jgi:hypothetical protein
MMSAYRYDVICEPCFQELSHEAAEALAKFGAAQSAHVEQTEVSDERFNACDLRGQENNTLGEADEATILCR